MVASLRTRTDPVGFPSVVVPSLHRRHPVSSLAQAHPSRCRCRLPHGGRVSVHATDKVSGVASSFIVRACQCHYPGRNRSILVLLSSRPAVGLPPTSGGPASTSTASRPARHSRMFQPAWPLNRSRRPFFQCASIRFVISVNRPSGYQPARQFLGGVRAR